MRTHLQDRSKILITIFFLLITVFGYSQKFVIPDSLQGKTIDDIEDLIDKYSRDSIKVVFFSNVLLAKAKREKDTLGLAKGYFQVSFNHFNNSHKRITYLDSSIAISNSLKHKKYPAVSYISRAGAYKQIGNYNKALDDYLVALNLTDKVNNSLFYDIKHNIGRLKDEIGEYEEAKEMYKDIVIYEDQNNINGRKHLITILGLANTYRKLHTIDSAAYYSKIGIRKSMKDNLSVYYLFVLTEGIISYNNKQYKASLDSLNKSIPYIEKYESHNMGFIVDGYLHLSKIYEALDDTEMSLKSLQKIDWYYENLNYTSIEMREGYELLINYYKSIDDKNTQLHYINRLFTIDSILDSNYKNLNKKITKEYDTPQLLEEKQNLITVLEQKEKTATLKYSIAAFLIIVLIIFFTYMYYKNTQYKKRYKEIMQPKNEDDVETADSLDSIKNKAETKVIDIPENIVKGILEKLTQFEEKKGFLSRNITITTLAKKLNTNSKYLSKIINQYKQKRFSLYINELRVDYVIRTLKDDPKFRRYSIKAIAREIGYNNDRAFSKAFYQKTGVYPSYFINQLEKEK
ncbi:AraC family transcriptional regulator [Aquimarina algiphila]|uniref:AraC family transcriptional regulator n=1 Tax=Aquimarina algiphila TaxID=2047982 RepID=UPI00232C4090|nr:AraC family transcriptional regulator [Aquimarina algiphila]